MRKESYSLLEQAADSHQLQQALQQVEDLRRELQREKEEVAQRETDLQAEIHRLTESGLSEERKNKGKWRRGKWRRRKEGRKR